MPETGRCQSEFDPVTLLLTGCNRKATTYRVSLKWPPAPKGEPQTERTRYCAACARMADEARHEAAWEARVS
jgi:hypothetical protein